MYAVRHPMYDASDRMLTLILTVALTLTLTLTLTPTNPDSGPTLPVSTWG